jgi:Xaa-Pro dipeptidase
VADGARRARLGERLARRNLDAWVLVPGPNLRYVTGLAAHPSERVFLLVQPAEGGPFAVVPHMEAGRVRQALAGWEGLRLFPYRDESGPGPALARAFGAYGTRAAVFGAEFGVMRLCERAAVESVVPRARWQDIDPDLAALRQVKDAEEVAALRRAAAIAAEAAAAGTAAARAGVSEREVAAACQAVLQRHHTTSPFGVMVASGPRSADPHATTGDRRLEPGDVVWIDVGAEVDGYCGDVTRTVVVPGAEPDSELARALEVVRRAQQAAVQVVRPGTTAAAVDTAARAAIAEAGLGTYFPHRTGHGLGLQPHEPPYLVDGSEEPLLPGMVFTVEPGVYLPGKGGVRIEDVVLVTPDGAELLTGGRGGAAGP